MKKNVALITGGLSGEAEVSYKSAKNIQRQIEKDKFEIFVIDICTEGWLYILPDGTRQQVDKNDFSVTIAGNKILFDVALMCIHGTPGEDGKLAGYFDLIGLPYTSCNAATAAITFNKRFTVAIANISGVQVARSVVLFKNEGYKLDEIKTLRFPVFVKPNNGGSSVNTFKVVAYDEQRLKDVIDKALQADGQVLIEEFIKGRELTVGVYKLDDKITVLPMSEVIMPASNNEDQFFDFEAKYSGKTQEITPANVSDEIKSKINAAAQKLYEVLNCTGIVRIDFIYEQEEKIPYMLEVNSVPGQTDASFVPQQFKAAGIELGSIYTRFMQDAMATKNN